MTAPLTPADCDLRDFAFMPLDVHRLLSSETWILGSDSEKIAALSLWLASWHQIPAASLPNSDKMLAHLSGAGSAWKRVRAHALRGWVECDDGRLYHRTVAEKANEAWQKKLSQRERSKKGNAARWGSRGDNPTDPSDIPEGSPGDPQGTQQGLPDGSRNDPKGQGQREGQGKKDLIGPSNAQARARNRYPSERYLAECLAAVHAPETAP